MNPVWVRTLSFIGLVAAGTLVVRGLSDWTTAFGFAASAEREGQRVSRCGVGDRPGIDVDLSDLIIRGTGLAGPRRESAAWLIIPNVAAA